MFFELILLDISALLALCSDFPVGDKILLTPAPARWQLFMHMADGLMYESTKFLSLPAMSHLTEGRAILRSLSTVLREGKEKCMLQTSPHLILLNEHFYHANIKPIWAQWALLYIKSEGVGELPDELLFNYLMCGNSDRASAKLVYAFHCSAFDSTFY